jgi:hypothetical protein
MRQIQRGRMRPIERWNSAGAHFSHVKLEMRGKYRRMSSEVLIPKREIV